jgi:presenilin-like A22 family membrane protease
VKYKPITILYLLLLFTIAQFMGLYITNYYATQELPYTLEPPQVSDGLSIAYIVGGIVGVTIIFYLFTKLKYERFLKLWFSVAVFISLSISLSVFVGDVMGLVVSFVLTTLRLTNKDAYVHNITEVFIYGGIVSLFAPLFSPLSAFIMLIIIAIYDYVSVFITKHMITLAKSQASANVFTGLVIKHKGETAILGGGDLAFSLLFASVLGGVYGLAYAYITIYAVLVSLAILTILGRKGKFYPAIPFITGACAVSYVIALL